MKILRRYNYDPLDRLAGLQAQEQAFTQRFYQENDLVTELGEEDQQSIFRHGEQPLAQRQIRAGEPETALLASDQAHSVLQVLSPNTRAQMAYSAYGHHGAESGLGSLLGFNGESPDAVTGHYLLGQGKRAFNPVLMRFNSPDELSPFGEGGINPYGYCMGDPINFYDPSGNSPLKLLYRFWNTNNKVLPFKKRALDLRSITIGNPGSLPSRAMPTSVIVNRVDQQPARLSQSSTSVSQRATVEQNLSAPPKKTASAQRAQLNQDAKEFDVLSQKYPDIYIPKNPKLLANIKAMEAARRADIKAGRHTKTLGHFENINRENKRIKQMQLVALKKKIRNPESN